MAIEQAIELENTVQEFGYASVNDFALQQAKNLLLKDLQESLAIIAEFEAKYDMNYESFQEKFNEIKNHTIFEKEDDGMEWSAEIEGLKLTEKKLNRLR